MSKRTGRTAKSAALIRGDAEPIAAQAKDIEDKEGTGRLVAYMRLRDAALRTDPTIVDGQRYASIGEYLCRALGGHPGAGYPTFVERNTLLQVAADAATLRAAIHASQQKPYGAHHFTLKDAELVLDGIIERCRTAADLGVTIWHTNIRSLEELKARAKQEATVSS